tara:strand:+ start:3172 stop:3441 length:270 start_codon:yes stop_codon:yes gene_type:complete
MVPKGMFMTRVNAPAIMPAHKEFISPIDGKVISTRQQLKAHNKEHGVTNASDYSGGYIEKKAHQRVNAGKKYLKETRRSDIHEAFDRHR